MKYDNPNELLLYTLAIITNSKNVLELGVREGYSTRALLQAIDETNGHLYSVDIEDRRNLYNNHKWTFRQCDAIRFLANSDLSNIDLIFIDDWHSRDHVSKELEIIHKNVKINTLIVMHDTMVNSNDYNFNVKTNLEGEFADGGPAQALFNFLANHPKDYEYLTIPVDHGLTILRRVT